MDLTPVEIPSNCPYANGVIIDYGDGTSSLELTGFTYTPQARDEYYTIQDTDNLSDIANVKYGDSKWWWVLALTNGLQNPWDDLTTGLTIIIPDLDLVKLALQ